MHELQQHQYWMQYALNLAREAGTTGEVPVGAVVVDADNQLVATGRNQKEGDRDPTAHAEVLALRQAARRLQHWHLGGCTLYVTLEPCPMCAGAIVQSRLSRLVYGADDPKTGAVRTVFNLLDSRASNHRCQVFGGILETPCRQLLQQWFVQRRRSTPHTQTQARTG